MHEASSAIQTIQEGLSFFCTVGLEARKLAARTRVEYTKDITDLADYLGQCGLQELTQVRLTHLRMYQNELIRRGLRVASCNRKTDTIKMFFRFLYHQEVLSFDVAEYLIPPTPPDVEPRILTQTEYQRLLEVCKQNTRDHAIIVLYLQTGMRLSELVRLRVSDIELPSEIGQDENKTGFARVSRSNGKSERVPLNYKACLALIAYLKERTSASSPTVFLNQFDKPLSARRIQYMIQGYLENIGVHDASVKSLRHTMAAHHVAQGTELQVLQETLGISLEATEKYLTLAKKTARKALQEHAL